MFYSALPRSILTIIKFFNEDISDFKNSYIKNKICYNLALGERVKTNLYKVNWK